MGNISKHAVLALLPTSESQRETLREKYIEKVDQIVRWINPKIKNVEISL